MATGNPSLVAKTAPPCPYCGAEHDVYVTESDDPVAVFRQDGDIDWAKEYPFDEGYRYYHKKCGEGRQQELRVVVSE